MCDALSRNAPKLPPGVEILLANCLAHGKKAVRGSGGELFPTNAAMCWRRWSQVYGHDAEAREQSPDAGATLARFHQQHSGPVIERLHGWLEAQFAEHKTEPNSGLGKAITYLLRHWRSFDDVSPCRWGTTG